MVRRLLPLCAPLLLGLAAGLLPDYAPALHSAALGALLTVLLALPVLLWGLPSAPTAASGGGLSWGRIGWQGLAASSIAALLWMVGSFVAMALDPAGAATWSFHVLGSLLALTLLIPLAVFLQPAPSTADAEKAAVEAFQNFQTQATHAASPRPTRPFWSYMEEAEAAQGDGAGSPGTWAEEPDLTATGSVPTILPPHQVAASTAALDTDWEMSIWPFDSSDDWFHNESAPNTASSSNETDEAPWPPSDWPAFERPTRES